MHERQRRRLRKEYLKLRTQYDRNYPADECGVALAEYIRPELAMWRRRMQEIEAEVEAAIREERARGNAVPFET
jgi:hypothetical protein